MPDTLDRAFLPLLPRAHPCADQSAGFAPASVRTDISMKRFEQRFGALFAEVIF